MKPALLFLCLSATAFSQVQNISGERIRAHTKFLSSDLLEGRGVGARGGDLATEYIATQFALFGAKPAGDNGTYFQKVPLVGVESKPTSQLTAIVKGKDDPVPLGRRIRRHHAPATARGRLRCRSRLRRAMVSPRPISIGTTLRAPT